MLKVWWFIIIVMLLLERRLKCSSPCQVVALAYSTRPHTGRILLFGIPVTDPTSESIRPSRYRSYCRRWTGCVPASPPVFLLNTAEMALACHTPHNHMWPSPTYTLPLSSYSLSPLCDHTPSPFYAYTQGLFSWSLDPNRLLADLHAHRTRVALIQETHFKREGIQQISNYRYPRAYHVACYDSKLKDVSLLFSHRVALKLEDSIKDDHGRYLFLKGTIEGKTCTFANIYCPNSKHATCIQEICHCLQVF